MYLCEIPGCERKCSIRTRIKSGDFQGKKACPSCKNKLEPKEVKRKPFKKGLSQKTIDKRKKEREGLSMYFQEGIYLLKKQPYCQNCGVKINVNLHPVNNVCHILSKRTYKSVSSNPCNRLFLCDSKDNVLTGKSCHADFDTKIKDRSSMPVFQAVILLYNTFRDDVTEWGREREIIEGSL